MPGKQELHKLAFLHSTSSLQLPAYISVVAWAGQAKMHRQQACPLPVMFNNSY